MRKFTLLIASLFITIGAMAQTYTIAPSSGSFNQSGWAASWTSSGLDVQTTFSVQSGANNMDTNSTTNFAIYSGRALSSTYVLAVDANYKIVSYSFKFASNNGNTITAGDKVMTANTTEQQTFEVTDVNSNSTSFVLAGANSGITITDFTITVESLGTVVNITYKFTYNGVVKEDYTYVARATDGYEFPAITAEFPFGITATKPEGIVEASDEGQTYTIELEENLPFVVADSYENITHWYYLAIKPGEVDYLYHEAGQTNIPLTVATKPAAEAKYAWAFVGNPFDGYRIYNYAAGADMVLSSSTTMAGTNGGGTHPVMTALPVADGNNELWIATASTYGTNGFFLAQKGFANNRMNNRDDKLAYWTGGADAGSTFYVERCIVPDGYYRIAYDNSGTEYYLQGVASTVKGCAFTTETDAKSIWYYGNSRLLSYTAGEYIKEVSDYRGLQGIGVDGGAVTIAASSRDASKYTIACTSYLHFNTSDDSNYFGDHCGSDGTDTAHDMILENVMSLPVTISEAGFATLYAPVALKVADGVVAYTVTLNGQWATLNKIESGVIPANTGVVLAGEVVDNEVTPATADTYDFVVTTTDATVTSALSGSAPATYYTETGTYYALAQVDGVVGFYKDQFNNSRFQNNSHKAYLYVADAAGIASYSFRFGEGTTGVEKVEIRNEKSEIYDLTGRRVEAITAPGIYIVGGKKVLVK